MKMISQALILMLALGAAALAFGFVLFAVSVTRDDATGWDKADGIVVLTGGDNRIEAGAKLMSEGRAKRMLISGVNRKVSREEMQRLLNLDKQVFNCCVDLGYEALDTVGNADETRTWANTNGYTRLIIVTSRYHMPRSLAELSGERRLILAILEDAVALCVKSLSEGAVDRLYADGVVHPGPT